jgi:hypothetical protein
MTSTLPQLFSFYANRCCSEQLCAIDAHNVVHIPRSWIFDKTTNEDLLPIALRKGWHDSLRIIRTSVHWLASGSRKGYRWIRQSTKVLQSIDEECL